MRAAITSSRSPASSAWSPAATRNPAVCGSRRDALLVLSVVQHELAEGEDDGNNDCGPRRAAQRREARVGRSLEDQPRAARYGRLTAGGRQVHQEARSLA